MNGASRTSGKSDRLDEWEKVRVEKEVKRERDNQLHPHQHLNKSNETCVARKSRLSETKVHAILLGVLTLLFLEKLLLLVQTQPWAKRRATLSRIYCR